MTDGAAITYLPASSRKRPGRDDQQSLSYTLAPGSKSSGPCHLFSFIHSFIYLLVYSFILVVNNESRQ